MRAPDRVEGLRIRGTVHRCVHARSEGKCFTDGAHHTPRIDALRLAKCPHRFRLPIRVVERKTQIEIATGERDGALIFAVEFDRRVGRSGVHL